MGTAKVLALRRPDDILECPGWGPSHSQAAQAGTAANCRPSNKTLFGFVPLMGRPLSDRAFLSDAKCL